MSRKLGEVISKLFATLPKMSKCGPFFNLWIQWEIEATYCSIDTLSDFSSIYSNTLIHCPIELRNRHITRTPLSTFIDLAKLPENGVVLWLQQPLQLSEIKDFVTLSTFAPSSIDSLVSVEADERCDVVAISHLWHHTTRQLYVCYDATRTIVLSLLLQILNCE